MNETISQKIAKLNSDRTACITNLLQKGVVADNTDGFSQIASKILEISSDKLTSVYVDNEISYRKQVPPNSAGVCYLNSIGGMTYKGFTFECTVEEFGGEYSAPYSFTFPKAFTFPTDDLYAFAPVVCGRTDAPIGDASGFYTLSGTTMTGQGNMSVTDIPAGTVLRCIPRFENQETGDYWFPPDCFTDLRDAKPTAVVSYGANFYNEDAITFASNPLNGANAFFEKTDEYFKTTIGTHNNYYRMQPFGAYLDVGTYTLSFDAFIPTGGAPTLTIAGTLYSYELKEYSSSSGGAVGQKTLSAYDTWERAVLKIVITKPSTYYLAIQGRGDDTQNRNMDVRYKNICLTRTADSEYVPYRAPITYNLPTAITNYLGKGCSDTLYDEYSFVDKKAITRVGEGVVDALRHESSTSRRSSFLQAGFDGMRYTSKGTYVAQAQMPFFDFGYSINQINADGYLQYVGTICGRDLCLYVPTPLVSADVNAFISWVNSQNFRYLAELNQFTETSINTDFNPLIEVEAGGYLEFVNDYGYAVPSTVTFSIINGGGTT